MPACPCCLEDLRPAFLGLGGRRLVGACEVCGERVCEACLRAQVLEAGAFRSRQPPPVDGQRDGQRKVPGFACLGCLWTLLQAQGTQPPFPQPRGHHLRRTQARCAHPRRVRWMRGCPDCGSELGWQVEPDAPTCDACGAPTHDLFNACWSCGESFEEENDPALAHGEAALDCPCSDGACSGRVAWPMRYCPWCATEQRWPHTTAAGALDCGECEAPVDPTWAYCTACSAEAPLPARCLECGERLEQATCAARCEQCRHLVCGECFGDFTLPAAADGDAARELLLCLDCAEALGAVAVEEASGPVSEEADPDEDPEEEADASAPEPPGPPQSAWEVLGVAPGTPLPEVRRVYLALVAQYHPDKVAQLGPKLQALALEETRKLNDAWGELRAQAG